MSNTYDESEIEKFINDEDDDSHLVRDLRRQLRAANGKVKEHVTTIQSFEKDKRKQSVSDVLSEKGVKDPRVVKLYPADQDSSPEAVTAWLDEIADLLGIEIPSQEDEATASAAARISQAQASVPRQADLGSPADLQSRLLSAKTKEEYAAVMADLERVRIPG